jgi:type VI secretion system protein VasD
VLLRALVKITITAVITGVFVFGCGGTTVLPECEVPGEVGLVVDSSARLNPDRSGEPLPTILRLFQLSDVRTAETATFRELWNKHEEILGESVKAMDEVTIWPERHLEREFERNPEANYVLAMGLYRRPAGFSWRVIFELPPTPEEQECAARAGAEEDEEEAGPELVNPSLRLYMEDYRIEGALRLEAVEQCTGAECALELGEGEVNSAADSLQEGAESEAGGAAGDAASEAAGSAPTAPAPKGSASEERR